MSIKKGSRTIASSVPITEWGSIDGTLADQADLKSALDSKADTYSPTFTGTPLAPTAPINVSNNQIATTKYVQEALLNAGSDLPDQEGQSGKFLTTNGQIPSWANVDALPSQSGNNGKYLITNGTSASWSTLNGVVHTTGDETISGQKTINESLVRSSTIDQSSTTGETEVRVFHVKDKDNYEIASFNATRSSTTNTNRQRTINHNLTNAWFDLRVNVNDTGKGYITTAKGSGITSNGSLSDVSSSTSDENIPTKGWVNNPATSTNVVHRSGDETIAGVKTFSSVPLITGGSSQSSGKEGGELHLASIANSSSNNFGIFDVYSNNPEDSTTHCIRMRMSSGNSGLKVFNDGHAEIATAPAANSNDSSIPTTSWVNTKINGITLTSGNDISIDSNKAINYTGPKYYRLSTRTWTYAQWTQYCERGVTTNISASYDVTGIKVGDLVTVEGICTDRNNCSVLAWGIVTAIDTNITTSFIGINFQDAGNVVHTTGDETISGVKTFQNNITAPNQVDYSQITNCFTEIPQDIELTLNNEVLRLKAGSKVYVPNGFEADGITPKFDVVTIDSDRSLSPTGLNRQDMFTFRPNGNAFNYNIPDRFYSGSVAPSGSQHMTWYDTDNNLVKVTSDSGSTWTSGYSLPIGMFTSTSQIDSIDQIFNGFGYIGSTVFALPGVKGLIPDGRNEDGTLRNIEFTITEVVTRTYNYKSSYPDIGYRSDGVLGAISEFYYDEEFNKNSIYGTDYSLWFDVGPFEQDSTGKITSFTPKTTFHAVDYNDIVDSSSVTDNSAKIATTAWVNTRLGGTGITSTELGYLDGVTSNIQTQLNGKQASGSYANTSASNFNTTGKSTIVGWSMPDYSASISFSTGSNYTVPKDGIIVWNGSNSDMHTQTIKINNTTIISHGNNAGYDAFVGFLPVRKGDVVLISIGTQGTSTNKFYPLKGA